MKIEEKYRKLGKFGHDMLEYTALNIGLPKIAAHAKSIIEADRCSVYIYDKKKEILWTTLADGIKKIVIPSDCGIIGYSIKNDTAIIENDPYSNRFFDNSFDKKNGYHTRNILTTPIHNFKNNIIGAIQLLNKNGGDFEMDDLEFLEFFTHFVSGFIELSIIQQRYENDDSQHYDIPK